MPDPDLVRTGIAGLDEILSGGIPRGNVILLEGAIGCGKTTLGVEFVYRGAANSMNRGSLSCSRCRRTRSHATPGVLAGIFANWSEPTGCGSCLLVVRCY